MLQRTLGARRGRNVISRVFKQGCREVAYRRFIVYYENIFLQEKPASFRPQAPCSRSGRASVDGRAIPRDSLVYRRVRTCPSAVSGQAALAQANDSYDGTMRPAAHGAANLKGTGYTDGTAKNRSAEMDSCRPLHHRQPRLLRLRTGSCARGQCSGGIALHRRGAKPGQTPPSAGTHARRSKNSGDWHAGRLQHHMAGARPSSRRSHGNPRS